MIITSEGTKPKEPCTKNKYLQKTKTLVVLVLKTLFCQLLQKKQAANNMECHTL